MPVIGWHTQGVCWRSSCHSLLSHRSSGTWSSVSRLVMSDSLPPHMDCIACQAPLSMEFSRQEYWRGLPCPSPEDLLDPGIEPMSSASPELQGDSLQLSYPGSPCSILCCCCCCCCVASVVSDSVQPTRLLHPWDFPGKSTGVGCHCLLW